MKLHEFQSKEILSRYGLAVPKGGVAITPEQARQIATELGTRELAVKAQIHAGARGAARGIKLVSSPAEAEKAARHLLGRRLVTNQSGPAGWLVKRVLVEAAAKATRSVYLSLRVEPSVGGIVMLGSGAAGGDIERRVRSGEAILERLYLGIGDGFPISTLPCSPAASACSMSRALRFTALARGLAARLRRARRQPHRDQSADRHRRRQPCSRSTPR